MSASKKKVSGTSRSDADLDQTARKKRDPEVLQRGILAIDPGSNQTGWAWWPTAASLVPAEAGVISGGNGTIAERALVVKAALKELYETRDPMLGSIAIEKPIPHHRFKAIALETTYSEISAWARTLHKKRGRTPGLIVSSYNNKAVKAVVNPKYGEFGREGGAKERLMAGVCSSLSTDYRLYPEDAIDAIAIGILHLQIIRQEILIWQMLNEREE
jgi:Holliday junction resolvasome RuvABC endonuclease subunit